MSSFWSDYHEGEKMKTTGIIMLLFITLLAGLSSACGSGSPDEESSPISADTTAAIPTAAPTQTSSPALSPSPTPNATLNPSPSPASTEPPECEEDRQAIKAALDSYYAANGEWPTVDGQPGLIVWNKIIPAFLEKAPSTSSCKWQVNSDPLGEVCRSTHC